LSGESARMTYRRRQNRRRQPPFSIGIRVDTQGENGEYRRRRAVVPLPRFLSHLSHFDGLNVRFAPRRAGGDTRHSPPRVDANAFGGVVCGGFAAADTSYVIVCASFVPIHHSKQPVSFYWRTKSLALAREVYRASGIGLVEGNYISRTKHFFGAQ